MTRLRTLLVAGLLLAATACGEGTGDSPAGPEPAERPTHPLAFGPDAVGLADWEWFRVIPERIEEFRGRVVDPDGRPAAGAGVEIVVMPMRQGSSPKPIDRATTRADGEFRFENVPANAWVQVSHPDWAGLLTPVGQVLAMTEPGRLVLRPGTRIQGTLSLPDGTPVPDWPIQASNRDPDWSVLVHSNDQGRYAIDHAPAGQITLIPLPGRYGSRGARLDVKVGIPIEHDITVSETPAVTGQVLDAETGAPVAGAVVTSLVRRLEHTVTDAEGRFRIEGMCRPLISFHAEGYAEETRFVDPERVSEQALPPVMLERGMRVRGRVVDTAGNPVEGARVNAFLDPDEMRRPVRGPLTSADGTFDFSWLPPPEGDGSIVFTAVSRGSLATPGPIIPVSRERPLEDLELLVHRPASIELRLVNEKGEPLVAARVRVERRSAPIRTPEDFTWPGGIGFADPDGRVRVGGLGTGTYILIIHARNRVREMRELDLESEEHADLGDVVLDTGLSVHGRVVSASGEGLRAARLTITRLGTHTFERIDANPDGTFLLTGFTPGPLSIRAVAPGYEPLIIDAKAGGPELEISLKRYGRLEIVIVRPEEARTPGRIEIARVEGGKPKSRSMPRDEDLHEYPEFQIGRWWIRVEVEGWYGLMEVTVLPGRTAKIEIELERGAVLAGRLTSPDGAGVPRAAIEVEPLTIAGRDEGPEAWGSRSTTTDPTGSFLLRVVPPGRVKLRTHPPGYPPQEFIRTVKAGERVDFRVELSRGGALKLTAVDQDGKPVAGAIAGLTDAEGEPVPFWLTRGTSARTDNEGRLEMAGIAPGTYDLSLLLSGEIVEKRRVEIPEGDPVEVAIAIER